MDGYSIALFLHIVGVLGIFVALGLEWTGLWQIRSAMSPEQVRTWMGILKSTRGVGFASMVTTLITGIYMMVMVWGVVAWISVTMGALVLVILLSLMLTGPRMAAVGRALATGKGTLSTTFHSLASHPLLLISINTRVAIALGIVLLKTAKPGLAGSLLTIGVAIALGIAAALSLPRREQAQERLAH